MINCYRVCSEYSSKKCLILNVCNGYSTTTACHSEGYQYRVKVAEANYKELLKSAREGLNVTANQLKYLDELISSLIIKGQSISHTYANHKSETNCSERTIYKYFEKDIFMAKNIALPRKVKFKTRKKNTASSDSKALHRIGRTYDDFNTFFVENPDTSVVEMDTVHGTRSGKVLRTLFLRNTSLMLAFIIDSCTQLHVKEIVGELYKVLGSEVLGSASR